MSATSWRRIIGMVHPTLRPGSNDEVIRLVAEGIAVLALHVLLREIPSPPRHKSS